MNRNVFDRLDQFYEILHDFYTKINFEIKRFNIVLDNTQIENIYWRISTIGLSVFLFCCHNNHDLCCLIFENIFDCLNQTNTMWIDNKCSRIKIIANMCIY